MHDFLLMRTGLVSVGKGRPQHMSKLHYNADAWRARGIRGQSRIVMYGACAIIYVRGRNTVP